MDARHKLALSISHPSTTAPSQIVQFLMLNIHLYFINHLMKTVSDVRLRLNRVAEIQKSLKRGQNWRK